MIAKHIAMQSGDKSSALRLVRYITDSQDKRHRVAEVFTANCVSEDEAELAAYEMLAVQRQNARAKADRTYHLLISFRPGEEPDIGTLRLIEKEICERLGFGEHQRIAVVHKDTDNTHMHIAVNKIHPTRFTLREPFQAYAILAKSCVELEKSLHLFADNHAKTGKTAGERAAGDIEAMSGQESLLSWIKRECLAGMKAAETWDALHRELARANVCIKQRGNGFVMCDASGAAVKASDVDRGFSKANLEKRLGVFQSADSAVQKSTSEKRYDKKPLGPDSPLKQEFFGANAANDEKRVVINTALNTQYREAANRIWMEDKAARLRARKIRAGQLAKRKLYRALSAKRRRELERLSAEMRVSRREVKEVAQHHSWLSWLQEQAKNGRSDALALLRKRAFALGRKAGRSIRGEEDSPEPAARTLDQQAVDAVTKRGTILYRVGDDALRDDGASLRLAKTASVATIAMALRLAQKRFGDTLRIDGDHAFRELALHAAVSERIPIRFADPLLEERRRAMRAASASRPIRTIPEKGSCLE